ncbi:hypothetical protein PRJH_2027 [Providencia rustigianii]
MILNCTISKDDIIPLKNKGYFTITKIKSLFIQYVEKLFVLKISGKNNVIYFTLLLQGVKLITFPTIHLKSNLSFSLSVGCWEKSQVCHYIHSVRRNLCTSILKL